MLPDSNKKYLSGKYNKEPPCALYRQEKSRRCRLRIVSVAFEPPIQYLLPSHPVPLAVSEALNGETASWRRKL